MPVVNTRFLSPRLGALAGLTASVAFALLWIAAAYLDGGWTLGKMTLSELGDRSRPGAQLFNTAAVLAGALGLLFSAGLYRVLSTSTLGKMSAAAMGLASVLLIGVGLFPIDTGSAHTAFSYAFFITAAAAMALIIVPAWRSHVLHRSIGALTPVLLGIGIIGVATLEFPAAEALAVSLLLLWMALVSVRMLWHHPAR
ncbi:MAG: DUF998 domain-containing protein [Methanomassiliicoccus sp.]|nr:DUF998 domain-containing protein [Methanomassiliicoccus sp.]